MTPRYVVAYRQGPRPGTLTRVKSCTHTDTITVHPKLDVRSLPRSAVCAQCEEAKNTPTPPRAA